jgi:hypothetical protein
MSDKVSDNEKVSCLHEFEICKRHDSCMYNTADLDKKYTRSSDHEWPRVTTDGPREWQKAVSEQIVIKEATSVSLCGYLVWGS